MNRIVLDRDGVLFDTCEANLSSYVEASNELRVAANLEELDNAIKAGTSIVDFHRRVWPNLHPMQLTEIQEAKARLFRNCLDLIRINSYWSFRIASAPENFHLATKASLNSTIFLLEHFLPQFLHKNIYSVQSGVFHNKVEIMKHISQENSPDEIVLIDDSAVTVKEVVFAGYKSTLSPHFCRIHKKNE